MRNKLKRYYEKRHEAKRYALWLWRESRSYLPAILFISAANGLMSAVGIGVAALNKELVDCATRQGSAQGLAQGPVFNGGVFLLLAAVTFANLAVSSGMGIYTSYLNEKFSFSMRKNFYAGILSGDWFRLSGYHSGNLMTRVTGDVDMVSSGVFGLVPTVIYLTVQFVTAFAILYHYDPALCWFALCMGPLGLLVSIVLGRMMGGFQKELRENEGSFRSFMQESMENLMVVKSFSAEGLFEQEMDRYWTRRFSIIKDRNRISFRANLAMGAVFSGSYLLTFGWSILRLSRGEITYGTVTLLLTLVAQLQSPVRSMRGAVQQLVGMLVSAGRLMEIIDIPRETDDGGPESGDGEPESGVGGPESGVGGPESGVGEPESGVGESESGVGEPEIGNGVAPSGSGAAKGARPLSGAVGVRARGLTFSYGPCGKGILDQVDFDIAPGEAVGVIGESGAGKTTLVRLLLALTRPSRGGIFLYDSRGVSRKIGKGTRNMIAYVPQGNTLLSGTIRANLLLSKPEAEDMELWEALQTAEVDEFVRRLPEGLDSRIGEKGGMVSEGQAQRIAIARAVLKKAPVLILDEATASLDTETEKRIIRNLRKLSGNTTCIVVTHRLSLLDICTRTFVISDGNMSRYI